MLRAVPNLRKTRLHRNDVDESGAVVSDPRVDQALGSGVTVHAPPQKMNFTTIWSFRGQVSEVGVMDEERG
jgi:hypothetical protein